MQRTIRQEFPFRGDSPFRDAQDCCNKGADPPRGLTNIKRGPELLFLFRCTGGGTGYCPLGLLGRLLCRGLREHFSPVLRQR